MKSILLHISWVLKRWGFCSVYCHLILIRATNPLIVKIWKEQQWPVGSANCGVRMRSPLDQLRVRYSTRFPGHIQRLSSTQHSAFNIHWSDNEAVIYIPTFSICRFVFWKFCGWLFGKISSRGYSNATQRNPMVLSKYQPILTQSEPTLHFADNPLDELQRPLNVAPTISVVGTCWEFDFGRPQSRACIYISHTSQNW